MIRAAVAIVENFMSLTGSLRAPKWMLGYVGAALVFGGLDAVWLSATSSTLYKPALGPVLSAAVRPVPALIFYVLYLAGLTIFAVAPAAREGRWSRATATGAMFGFFAYATYDLTNQATLMVWATRITVLDICWGAFASAAGATAGYFATKAVRS
jgi:uncharacterized membrane protein